MLKTTFFIAMCLGCIHGKKGEPLRVAYCKKFCLNKKHQACGCELRKGVSEPETMSLLITFRRAILAQHNKLRNKLASGKEDYNGSSSAADMMALSYSLELENMARCYLRSKFVGEDLNPCLGMANGQSVEQIVSMQNSLDVTDLQTHTIIKQWYGEIKNMKPEYYEKRPNPKYYNGHFTYQKFLKLAWSQINLVGCARLLVKNRTEAGFPSGKNNVVFYVCNYGSTIFKEIGKPIVQFEKPVYKKGEPCSACPNNVKPNQFYSSLCGVIEYPTNPANDIFRALNASTANRDFKFTTLPIVAPLCISLLIN